MNVQISRPTPGKQLLKRLGALWGCISMACAFYAFGRPEIGQGHSAVEVAFLIIVLAIPIAEFLILRNSMQDYRAYAFPANLRTTPFRFMRTRWWLFQTKLVIGFFVFGLVCVLWGMRREKDFFVLATIGTAINLWWVWQFADRMFRDESAPRK